MAVIAPGTDPEDPARVANLGKLKTIGKKLFKWGYFWRRLLPLKGTNGTTGSSSSSSTSSSSSSSSSVLIVTGVLCVFLVWCIFGRDASVAVNGFSVGWAISVVNGICSNSWCPCRSNIDFHVVFHREPFIK